MNGKHAVKWLWMLAAVVVSVDAGADEDVMAGRHVTVSGEGEVRVQPDLAVADLGVTARGSTASEAMSSSRRQMEAVLQALSQAGVREADVLTTDFAIHRETVRPSRLREEGGQSEERFVVRNVVQVILRDLEAAGRVLDQVIDAGANEVRGIRFTLEEDGDATDRARALAVQDARHKAEQLAQLHGANLGRVLRISESGVRSVRAEAMVLRAESSSSTVSAGEMTLGAHVQVVYELTD